MSRDCAQCGGALLQGKRFCSKTCWRAFTARSAAADRKRCQLCGETVKSRGAHTKYCSRECAARASRGRSLPAEQRAKIAESNRVTKAAARRERERLGLPAPPRKAPPRPIKSAGVCVACGSEFDRRVKEMCDRCYHKARYDANREHRRAVGRAWRERNPDYFKKQEFRDRTAARFRERYFGGLYEHVLSRDHSTCQACGLVSEPGRGRSGLHVHHIDGNSTNNVLENLQVLCGSCHAREHRRRGDFAPRA